MFLDLHFCENPWDDWSLVHDINSIKLMNTVLPSEELDYIVLNGDLITGKNTFRENSTKFIDGIIALLNNFRILFSSTHGNHDDEPNITYAEEIRCKLQVTPLSYTCFAPSWANSQGYGPGMYWVLIYTHILDFQPSLILWFFASRGSFNEGVNSTCLPNWANATDLNSMQDPGLNADKLGSGLTQATSLPQDASKDDPFWDALNKHVLNLHGVISGHDHSNKWCRHELMTDIIFYLDKHAVLLLDA
ncbi:hypothetical protein C8Q74DRAFT_1374247 [Fomes fomentarius]|nr:hypothetical protein C8Q74DRAFT_1374247 [Fomes fomentarius]